jgi:hypothetical protein
MIPRLRLRAFFVIAYFKHILELTPNDHVIRNGNETYVSHSNNHYIDYVSSIALMSWKVKEYR